MYKFLAMRIKQGYLTLEQLPLAYREKVKIELEKLK